MGAVADAVSDAVGGVVDAVGDVVDTVGDAVEDVGGAIVDVVDSALENPVQTIITIAAVAAAPATGGASLYAIPATSAATVLDNGGDFDDALKAAAISYVATTVGAQVAPGAGSYAAELGADAATQAAVQGATRAVVSGATRAALSGGDIGDAMVRSLAGYGLTQGVDYAINEAGQAIDNITGEMLADSDGTMSSSLTGEEGINAMDIAGPTPEDTGYAPEVGVDVDAFGREIGDTNPYAATYEEAPAITEADAVPGADYSLVPQAGPTAGYQEGDLGTGAETPALPPVSSETPVDYSLTPGGTQFESGQGFETIDTPNLEDMGGGQGLTVDVEGGTVGEMGLTPENAAPVLGDPDSFINNPEVTNTPIMEQGTPQESEILQAAKKYFQKQLVGNITGGIMQDIFGGDSLARPARGGRGYAPYQLMSSIFGQGATSDAESDLAASSLSDSDPAVDLGSAELFNPLGNATWAPQSKIGGLGFAGKYLNPESDSYYVNKEQEDRQKALDKLQSEQGWMTDEERQMLLDQAGAQDPSQASPFYDFNTGGFDPNKITYAADGGLMGHNPEFYSEGGASIGNRYVKGRGDGTSDSVPAMLASGEFVIPADVVSGLGNGDNDAGAKVLDSFMEEIRKHKRGGSPKQLPPDSLGPLSYLSSAMTKAKRK